MIVYICSRHKPKNKAEERRNFEVACDMSRRALEAGITPIAPHLMYPRFMDDRDRDERRVSLLAGLELLGVCDEVWYCGDYGISDGMKQELYQALSLKKPIYRIDKETMWREHPIHKADLMKEIHGRSVE